MQPASDAILICFELSPLLPPKSYQVEIGTKGESFLLANSLCSLKFYLPSKNPAVIKVLVKGEESRLTRKLGNWWQGKKNF